MPQEKRALDRRILLSNKIDNGTMSTIITSIFNINYDDKDKYREYKDFVIEPIQLYINSFGGSAYDGLALVDVIRTSETPIHTYCVGSAMSMGFWIYLSGDKRFAGKNSTFMYHEVAGWGYGKLEEIKQEVKEMERLQDMYDCFIKDRTSIMQDKLDDYRLRKAEWYIPAADALKLGICHEII